jgi:hypothetical protein
VPAVEVKVATADCHDCVDLIAWVGTEGAILHVILPSTFPLSLITLPVAAVHGIMEISDVVEVGSKIRLFNLVIAWIMARRMGIAGLGSEG